ncbi:MAG: metallophosphoesterase family protein [Chthoniobacterales bacterium]
MAETINWIHFTDLHFGLDRKSWLWPTVKHRVLQDLETLGDRVPNWDVVFFTGDLVQTGSAEEFKGLNAELEEIWRVLGKRGKPPFLCVVPGNHDLSRPSSETAIAKGFSQLWRQDEGLQRDFWLNPSSEFRSAVNTFFGNYTSWLREPPVPLLSTKPGALPGDFSTTFTKGAIKLGIIGLNSTFLQIDSGDYREKLDVHVSQLNAVCDNDPQRWIAGHTASVLLMHHPPSWLSPAGLQHFRQEIYPSGRFIAQLCGHLHEPDHFETSEAGAAPRRLRQAPSLFGLAEWSGMTPKKRSHGYNAGQFVFEPEDGLEKLWPRTSVLGRDGALNVAPDYAYILKDECVPTHFDLTSGPGVRQDVAELSDEKPAPVGAATLSLLDSEPTEDLARATLAGCPRFQLSPLPQYNATRQDEQSQFETDVRKTRQVWVAAEWGTGLDGFLAASLERLQDLKADDNVFLLRCEEAEDVNAVEALFPQQCGLSLQMFCTLAAALPSAFLILDSVHSNLCAGKEFSALQRLANLLVEYCPNLRLVITSSLPPEKGVLTAVELKPLELPEARTYLLNHPDASADIRDPDLIEILHDRSDGLPTHLDRLVKAMKVASPEAVLEADRETSITQHETTEPIPHALIHAVNSLSGSEDRASRRSFRLLQVLALLPYGETLEFLRHYLPTEPFFPENALKLQELGLIEIIQLQQTAPRLGGSDVRLSDSAPKLLKVSRPVRDYVLTLLSDTEKEDIVRSGIEKFFGRSWRSKVKLRKLPIEQKEYLNAGPGNEFALIYQLATISRARGDAAVVSRAANLGIEYAEHLENAERWHDLSAVGSALLKLIDRDRHPAEWAKLMRLYGAALRMSGKREESLIYLRTALEGSEEHFTDEEKALIWREIALADKNQDTESAAAAAKEALKFEKRDSAGYLATEAIVAETTLVGQKRIEVLEEIEKRARTKGFTFTANTSALKIYQYLDDPKDELRYLERVLKSEERGYTRTRALVNKGETLTRLERPSALKGAELVELTKAYTYLHGQRFDDLLDRCHEILWRTFEAQGDTQRLLRLFKHSSFLWRLRGRDEQESEYLRRLSEAKMQERAAGKTMILEFSYFLRRLRIILHIE